MADEEDVADARRFGVGAGEEAGAGAGGVEEGELVGCEEGEDGGFAECCWGGRGWVGFWAVVLFAEVYQVYIVLGWVFGRMEGKE